MLGNHPQISPLAIKEPGHFCDDIYAEGFSASYQKMLRWDEAQYFKADALDQRHMAFVQGNENYDRLVSEAADAQYILDASTAYLPSLNAAENIAGYNAEAKVIVSLRNPATRAYSHYNMARKYGKEQRSFLAAIKAEGALEKARWGWDECYLELGQYANQLQRWLECFPLDQLHIIWYDDFTANPQKAMDGLMKYLDLPTFVLQQTDQLNVGAVPKYTTLNKWAMRTLSPLREKLPKSLVHWLKKKTQVAAPELDPETRSFLAEAFTEQIEQLAALTGKDLNHWK